MDIQLCYRRSLCSMSKESSFRYPTTALIRSFLLHSVCDLKAAQIKEQRILIQEIMLHEFEPGHKAAENIKNICCAKGKGAVDHCTITRGFKKRLDNWTMSGKPKSADSEACFKPLSGNPYYILTNVLDCNIVVNEFKIQFQ